MVMGVEFRDRVDAGRQLAAKLRSYPLDDPIVVGLPRGGVPVAAEVARALGAPLDVLVVRKLGVPGHEELGFGAIGEDDVTVVDRHMTADLRMSESQIAAVEFAERERLDERVARYRADHLFVPLAGHDVVVVDDGVATGGTARAGAQVARHHGATRVILAVPVGSPPALNALQADYDEVISVLAPSHMYAVGEWYDDFSPTTDDDVMAILSATRTTERG